MTSLLGKIGDAASDLGTGIANAVTRAATSNDAQLRAFERDGFIVPPISSASGEGLPSSQTDFARHNPVVKRHIIHWFVPEVGVINMYINPQSINYKFGKLINSERTKGGYVMQYWGEQLPTLSISGNTGSSGIEGINVLYEIYRAEQLTFDPIGLTMASDSMVSGLGDLISSVGDQIGGQAGNFFNAGTTGLLGLNPLTRSILPRNHSTLSSLAFSVEMYYSGRVYRGYFNSFSYNESADRMGMFNYDIEFTVTQIRGTRKNTFPFQHSATHGPSNNSVGGAPFSYGKDPR